MPSLLPGRRGSQRTQPLDQNTTSNATSAAMSAFLQTSKSTNPLSSAAAAAALRSHTTSPEPVANLQTKRMVRRGSTSSNGSGMGSIRGGSRPGLQRSNSNGSMTERRFRASSEEPDRTMSLDSGAPPIPPIPADAHQRHNRASSLDPTQRVTSPSSSEQGTDRVNSPPPTTSRQATRLSNVAESEEAEAMPSSPTSPSRNFSRPMSPPLNTSTPSSAAKKYTHGTGSWYTRPSPVNPQPRPMTADGIPRSLGPPLDLSAVANRPVSTHRISSSPGSHLARANQGQTRNGSGPSSMSDSGDDFETIFDKHTRTFIRRPKLQLGEPSSPESPQVQAVYDKSTRSFVPKQESSAFTVTPIQSDRVASPEFRPRIYRTADPAEDPALLPPPRNPARLSPDRASPSSPRTPQILHKQPSVVREDPEAEQRAESLSPVSHHSQQIAEAAPAAVGPSRSYVAPATPHDRKASLDVPPPTSSAGRGRDKSASPSRSPHFSPSPILQAERHDPPPRGVSPVKSAMKHSPASSVRTASPIASFSPPVAASTSTVSPPSEASEGASAQDALDSKKKKSVRVSFDEQAQEIQALDSATNPTAPISDEEDNDAIMKPRPALPSFGSVRRSNIQPQLAEKVTEMPPERHDVSSDHAIGGILRNSLSPLPPEVTSKETTGYSSDDSSEIEVPAVASAANPERAGVGDGLERTTEGSDPVVKDFASAPTDGGAEDQADDADVPAINLLPPTPGIEDDSKKDLSNQEESFKARAKARNSVEIVVPGSWGQEEDNEDESSRDTVMAQLASGITTQEASAAVQTAMPKPNESPVLHASPKQLSDIDEDSDDSAEFSDAFEDPSDFEEGGFASLDAIVESPIITPSAVEAKSKSRVLPAREPPESPTIQPITRNTENTDLSGTQDWGQTTAYWSRLTKEKRKEIERQHLSSDDEGRPAPKSTTARTTKNAQRAAGGSGLTALPLSKATKQTSSTQEPAMRKTMRAQTGPATAPAPAQTDEGVHMRRSMRSSGGLAPSLRTGPPQRRPQSDYNEPKGTLQKKKIRPTSSTSIASSSSGSMMQTQRPQSASGPKTQDSSFPSFPTKTSASPRRPEPPKVSARLQKELAKADDSDSESSFRRRRRGNSGSTVDSAGGKYSMRRSMRGASVDETPAPAPVERRPQSPDTGGGSKSGFRLRSLSPPMLFGRKKTATSHPPPPTATRTTLRSAPTPKNASGKSAPPSRASAPPAPRFKSRFADSDDSDNDAAPNRSLFRSRFADSDEDEPAAPSGLTPVRGIPRKAGRYDGDSTDLEDSDEDRPTKQSKGRSKVTPLAQDPAEIERAMAAARRNLGMSEEPAAKPIHTNEGSALAKGSLRNKSEPVKEDTPQSTPLQEMPTPITTPEKKRGFMGSILRRNRNSASSIQQIRPNSPPPPMPSSPAVKTSPVGNERTATDSPSSPTVGKLIRRQSDRPQIARLNSDYSTATAPPISDTTTAVATQNDEDWPLQSPTIPPVPPIPADLQGDVARPTTREGFSPDAVKLARTMRPDLAPRSKSGPQQRVRIQAGEEGSEPGEREKDMKAVYSRRTGKKKKFGRLRRAFGIED